MAFDPFRKTVDFFKQLNSTENEPVPNDTNEIEMPVMREESFGDPVPIVIMFADITGSTQLYEKIGNKRARKLVKKSLEQSGECVTNQGGKVIKTIGDAIMCSFTDPNFAIVACTEIQDQIRQQFEALPPRLDGEVSASDETYEQPTLSMKIGVHAGMAIVEETDVFGDAVNVASRISDLAKSGQILTTRDTMDQLDTVLKSRLRHIDRTALKGKMEEFDIFEVMWDCSADVTDVRPGIFTPVASDNQLRIEFGEEVIVLKDDGQSIVIGRGDAADITIKNDLVSREHARIFFRRGKFQLEDTSTNGTFVTTVMGETYLKREQLALTGNGQISPGAKLENAVGVVTYCSE